LSCLFPSAKTFLAVIQVSFWLFLLCSYRKNVFLTVTAKMPLLLPLVQNTRNGKVAQIENADTILGIRTTFYS
jgi:hypothetical protein